jgi:hypothetical protein
MITWNHGADIRMQIHSPIRPVTYPNELVIHLGVCYPIDFERPGDLFQIPINEIGVWCLHFQLLNNLNSGIQKHNHW